MREPSGGAMTVDKYLHACDASAAAGISSTTLFAAASDEDSVLRVYDRAAAGAPLSVLDVARFSSSTTRPSRRRISREPRNSANGCIGLGRTAVTGAAR